MSSPFRAACLQLNSGNDPAANLATVKAMVAEARRLVTSIPVDAKKASDKEVNAAFKDKAKADFKSKLETEWDTFAKANYGKAKETAEAAVAALR